MMNMNMNMNMAKAEQAEVEPESQQDITASVMDNSEEEERRDFGDIEEERGDVGDIKEQRGGCEEKEEEEKREDIIDVSNRSLSFPLLEGMDRKKKAQGLYLYNNVFTVIPPAVSRLKRIKTLKVFSNDVKLFPPEVGELCELEHLQVKMSSSELGGLPPLNKLHTLKVLELHKAPPRPSGFTLSSDISSLHSLTKLSVCHFSISFLPSEIGCLKNLEELDLSFNKLRNLPNNICDLTALKSLKVASNKLVDLPAGLSNLSNLTTLDLSNNRLTSLQSLNFSTMKALREFNAQHNKIKGSYQIPAWISCKLEGNEFDLVSSSSEEEVSDLNSLKNNAHILPRASSSDSPLEVSATTRHSIPYRQRKLWRRQCRENQLQKADSQQQRARQERLNSSRKNRVDCFQKNKPEQTSMESMSEESCSVSNESTQLKNKNEIMVNIDTDISFASKDENPACFASGISSSKDSDILLVTEADSATTDLKVEEQQPLKKVDDSAKSKSSKACSNVHKNRNICQMKIKSVDELSEVNTDEHSTGKRHAMLSDCPKPSKRTRSMDEFSRASKIYSFQSFCGVDMLLPDGFYDAGRDRPFKPLMNFEKENPCLDMDSREVILVDREKDEGLDAVILSAYNLLSGLQRSDCNCEQSNMQIDDFQRGLLLAFFVSDYFGGSDKSTHVSTMRRAAVGSKQEVPFVCSCSVSGISAEQILQNVSVPDISLLCQQSVKLIKEQLNSNVVPLGSLRYGVCRHRAILLKYLCDRADPPIPCELVRGYLDYRPHAWNVILVNRGGRLSRMLFDACRPFDIREENDPEYFLRYIPSCRFLPPSHQEGLLATRNSGTEPHLHEEIGHGASGSVVRRCSLGNLTAAAKVHHLETRSVTKEQQINFELSCLAEIRMLSVLRDHPCIVNLYGHQFFSRWDATSDGTGDSQVLQFIIAMEYVKGGSLEALLKKLSCEGKNSTPVKLALHISRDIAYALTEIHSKSIIHRDIKSKNVLIDLELKTSEGGPVVKLCDFDKAVPLQSSSHECCLAHHSVPPANICVGTPRWMAPEMVQTIDRQQRYGLEVDMWSFGCLILELLTLKTPFAGLTDVEVYNALQMEKRPSLPQELENFYSESSEDSQDGLLVSEEGDSQMLKLLIDLFYSCTEANPLLRPTASKAYELLRSVAGPSTESRHT